MDAKTIINQAKSVTEPMEDDEKANHARVKVVEAAMALKPPFSELIGSATVYYYRELTATAPRPLVLVQLQLGELPEDVAIVGLGLLRDRAMEAYGRKPPERRN